MAEQTKIPTVYRAVFTYIDPLFCLLGLYLHLFDPLNTLDGYSPSYANPPRIETVHLLDSMAGFFALLFVVEGVLLRLRPNDAAVWRSVELGGFLVDAFMTFGALRALRDEGRLDMSGWRWDDYRLVVANAVMGLLRLACAFGIGIGSASGKSKKV